MRLNLSPDVPAGQTGAPTTEPNPAPEPVKSAAIVKKTALKTPREIELEKVVSKLEDRLDGLSAWQKEVTSYLEQIDRRAPAAPPKAAPPKAPAPTSKAADLAKGVLDDVSKELGL